MKKYNSYMISLNEDRMKILFEMISNNSDGIVNYYYELIFKTDIAHGNRIVLSLEEYEEIDNPILYIFKNFDDHNIKDFKLDEDTNNYIYSCLKKRVREDTSPLKINYDLFDEKDKNYSLKKSNKSFNYVLRDGSILPLTRSILNRNKDLFSDEQDSENKYYSYKEAIKRIRGIK